MGLQLEKINEGMSKIILGCAALGEYDHGVVDKQSLKKAVYCALDLGVNTFDVADCYGAEFGLAERKLSEILGDRRKTVNIITKFGVRWNKVQGRNTRPKTFKDTSPEWATKAVDDSLKRLRLDCIPIYFIHWPDKKTPIEETVYALAKLQDAGKIRHIGLSNCFAYDILKANKITSISFIQNSYSLINRGMENEIFNLCNQFGIDVLCYGALAQGLLSGKYGCKEPFDKSDHRSRLPHFLGKNERKNKMIIATLKELGIKYNCTPSQLAVSWVLCNKFVNGVVLGAKNDLQVNENVKALSITLETVDRNKLNDISK